MADLFTCPRRLDPFAFDMDHLREGDYWRDGLTCSYCGSLKPEEFLDDIKNGKKVTPTDKNY